MTVTRLLLPLHPDVPFAGVVRQAVWLAERCGAHLLLLRVGVPAWDVADGVPEGVAVTRLAVAGEPVHQIVGVARAHAADLIMMATHRKWRPGDGSEGENDFAAFLRNSVVAGVLETAPCAVWVDTGQGGVAVDKPLCYLDLRSHSLETLARAGAFAATIAAPLTVGHVTYSTQIHAPGGASLTARAWQESFARTAAEKFASLQRQAGTDAALLIENGEPLQVIPRLVARAAADLLILGHWPASERWVRGGRRNDDSDVCRLIQRSRVPVLVFRSAAPAAIPQQSAPTARRRLLANLVILLPLVLILVAAIVVGFARTHPAHAPLPRVLRQDR